jgi:hypothetical protein
VLKGILYLLDYFQFLLDAKLTYYKRLHIKTTYTFNINLVYETYEHQNQGLVTAKLVIISLVLPKDFNMRVLQILAPPSLRLGLLESLENHNTYIVNIQYKCQSMGECNYYTLNCDYSLHTPTKQMLSSYFETCWYCITLIQKCISLLWKWTHWQYLNLQPHATLPISIKGSFPYENNKKDNTYIKIANPLLERLWDGQYPHISQQKVIVSHVICEILCNMKKLVH